MLYAIAYIAALFAKWPMRWQRILFAALPLSLLTPVRVVADTGELALGYALDGIVIDGHLDEWPAELPRYPLAVLSQGVAARDSSDLHASFRVGYGEEENVLYLAVEVQDQSLMVDIAAGQRLWSLDGCIVLLELGYGDARRRFHFSEHAGIQQVLGPALQLLPGQSAQLAVRRENARHIYEWKIDVGKLDLEQPIRLRPGMSLGLHLAVTDLDEDGPGTTSMTWVYWSAPDSPAGDLLLMGDPATTGRVEGRIAWDNAVEGTTLGRIGIRAENTSLHIRPQRDGTYAIDLPAGRYRLQAGYRRAATGEVAVQIAGGDTVRLRELSFARPPLGIVQKAGPGKISNAGPGSRKGAWHTYASLDGLHASAIPVIYQDRQGDLWFGSDQSGVARYDGERVLHLTKKDGLISDPIWSIIQDRRGNMWFGSKKINTPGAGVSRYDGETFVSFTVEDGLADNTIWDMLEDRRGDLWFATNRGISRYDGGTCAGADEPCGSFVNFSVAEGLPSPLTYDLMEDRQGRLWVATARGVSRYDGEKFIGLSIDGRPVVDRFTHMLEDREGNLWLATGVPNLRQGSGLRRYDGKTLATYTTDDGLLSNATFQLAEDAAGHIWITTEQGVSRYDGHSFTNFTSQDGLGANSAQGLLSDRNGQVWIGFWGGGISRYEGHRLRHFGREDGLASSAVHSAIRTRAGDLLFGTANGMSRLDGEGFVPFSAAKATVGRDIHGLYEDSRGHVWMGAFDGVFRFDGTSFRHFTQADGLCSNLGFAIGEDRRGHIWIASGWHACGVARYDGQQFRQFSTEDGLNSNRTAAFGLGSGGDLLIGTDVGVSRYDGETFRTVESGDGPDLGYVTAIFADRDGRHWFGALGQVTRYDGERYEVAAVAGLTTGSRVYSIAEDGRGHLYFGTFGGGVFRYDGLVSQALSTAQGLNGNAVHEVVYDGSDAVWIAGENGVTRFRPGSEVPSVRLVNVIADRQYGAVEALSMSLTQDFVSFQFRGRSLSTPVAEMAYVYRLRGHEDEWRTTRDQEVTYRDLPRGEYIFEVKAVERDLNHSAAAQVALNVVLPYAQMGWGFGLLSSILVIGLLWTRLVRARNAAEAANRAKSQFLANISHEIRTPMNAVLGYAQLLQHSDNLSAEDRRDLDAIRHSGDHLLTLINDVLDISKIEADRLDLYPADFDLNQLVQSLGAIFEMRCREKGLAWHLEGVGEGALLVCGDEAKIQQVLLNLLSNAVKFTAAGEVGLKLTGLDQGRYRFEVSDTGMGISAAEQTELFEPFHQGASGQRQQGTGLGLAISHRLVEFMGGELAVESAAGAGARFSFALSLAAAEGPIAADAATQGQIGRLADGCEVTALVVDDVEENRDILCRLLRQIGARVATAENGRQALERMRHDPPDIVFLDIRMPVMDGMETIARIKGAGEWRDIKAIAISASVLNHERRAFLEAGFDDFLAKPFRFERLCQCLTDHLRAEFTYDGERPTDGPGEEEVDWSDVVLPAELHARIAEAAELHRVTQLEAAISELASLGDKHEQFSRHLENLIRAYDMETILQLIKTIRHE